MSGRIHVSAAIIVDADRRVLFVRKAGTSVFMQPGGKPEPGEDAAACLVRELAEELSLDVPLTALHSAGSFTADAANEPGHTVVADVFHLDGVGLEPVVGAEIAELRWIGRAEASTLPLAPLSRDHLLPLVWG